MSLFEKIFKHDRESEKALHSYTVFTELNGYKPIFHSWGGEIYESELVRSAINAIATRTPSTAALVMPPAYPAPSPAG